MHKLTSPCFVHKKFRCDAGFTLIELSVVLIVLGLIVSAAFPILSVYEKRKILQTTKDNLHKAEQALDAYLYINGAYPCPASRLEKLGKKTFGKAIERCISDTREAASYLVQTNKSAPVGPTLIAEGRNLKKIRIGILPFRSLGLPDNNAIDGWGRLFQYAITENLTALETFDQRAGAIDVVAGDGQSRLTPPGTAQYVIFSTGENGKAGFYKNGVFLESCPLDALETENCDGDASFMDAGLSLQQAKGAPPGEMTTSYDDFIVYKNYDASLDGRGGLLYYYRDSCAVGFTEVRTQHYVSSGIELLSKEPFSYGHSPNPTNQALCFSTRYSVSMTLVVRGTGNTSFSCPDGWVNIGYLESGHETQNATYMVCAR